MYVTTKAPRSKPLQDVSLIDDMLYLLFSLNSIFEETFHGVALFAFDVLNEFDFAKATLTQVLQYFKIVHIEFLLFGLLQESWIALWVFGSDAEKTFVGFESAWNLFTHLQVMLIIGIFEFFN